MEGMNILSIHQESYNATGSVLGMVFCAGMIGMLVATITYYVFRKRAYIGLVAFALTLCVMTPIGITHLHNGDKTIIKVEAESQIMEYHLYKNYNVIDQDGRIITIMEDGWITENSYKRW